MKYFRYIPLLTLLAAITACDSTEPAAQRPDDYNVISFKARTQTVITRTNPYEDYDAAKHPGNMGVMGYYDIEMYNALNTERSVATPNPVFDNAIIKYDAANVKWTYSPVRHWNDYKGATSFDFFAYMPQSKGTTVTRATDDADTYTLSVPFAMPDGATLLTDQRQAPIVCALPEHKEGTSADGEEFTFERRLDFMFDQTLTAYRLLFMLDSKMGAMRQFRIKKVTLSGEYATAGTISRTYHWKNSEWSADAIKWDITRRQAADAATGIPNAAYADGDTTVVVTSSEYAQWGTAFYVIPEDNYTPTFSVTYDVEFLDQDGTTVVTRKDVTSTIQLNKNNFASLTSGGIAMVNPVRILIQPRYLYVMADQDAYTGYLLVQ